MAAQPCVGGRERAQDTACVCALAGNVQPRRDQLLCERVCFVMIRVMANYSDRLALRVRYAPKLNAC